MSELSDITADIRLWIFNLNVVSVQQTNNQPCRSSTFGGDGKSSMDESHNTKINA